MFHGGYVTPDYLFHSVQAGDDGYVGFPGVDFHEMRHRSRDGSASHGVPQERLEARLVVGRVSEAERHGMICSTFLFILFCWYVCHPVTSMVHI